MRVYNTQTKRIEDLVQVIQIQIPETKRFLVAIPHCGIYLPDPPADFPVKFIKYEGIEDDVDLGSEEIFDLVEFGGVIIKSNMHRNVVDLNRTVKNGESPCKNYNKISGCKKYERDLTEDEMDLVCQRYYWPFRSLVEKEMELIRGVYGRALLISGHTYGREGENKPGFCIGTGNGQNASSSLIGKFHNALEKEIKAANLNTDVRIDYPFSGSTGISKEFGKPQEGYESLLIEVNRELFLNSDRISERIKSIRECIAGAINQCLL